VADTAPGADRDWLAHHLYGAEPSAAPPTERLTDGAEEAEKPETIVGQHDHQMPPVDLDPPAATEPNPNAGAKKAAVWLGAGLLVAVAAIVAASLSVGADPPTSPPHVAAPPSPLASPVPTSAGTAPESDQALPYTASANCPAGSTSAQALTDTASDSAWVCVRGAPGAAVDGQVLRIDFGRSCLLTAVSVTPGWVAKTPGGQDEWLQHRVVSRLQYIFNDDDRTVFTQDTGTAHGPVTTPLPKKILASRVTVIVLQSARPPASPLPSVSAGAQPGFVDSLLGEGGGPLPPDASATTDPAPLGEPGADPVDATFAMSALTFFGHQPD